MPRKGENIYKRKDGRWEGRYIKGHRDSKTLYGYIYRKTYKEVKEKLLHAKTQPPQQALAMSPDVGLPFFAYARLWLSEKETTVKYSTYVKYRNLLEGYINPTIGNASIATRCIEVGFDIKSLNEILGHANANITLDRYVHPSMDLKKTNMDKKV